MMTVKERIARDEWFFNAMKNQKEIIFCENSPFERRRGIPIGVIYIEQETLYYSADGHSFPEVEKIKKKRRYLPKLQMMQWLLDNKWTVNEIGHWSNPSGCGPKFVCYMWRFCGKPLSMKGYDWLPEWIEEVEDEEIDEEEGK